MSKLFRPPSVSARAAFLLTDEDSARFRHFPSSQRSSVTIGNFDGLHLGHRRILVDLVRTAAASGTASVVMTFSPHPLQVLHPGKAPKLIIPTEDKIARIESLGVDYLLLVKFDEELSRLSGESFHP
jgi:riboflavin kinase/FMN adenylyltransferase